MSRTILIMAGGTGGHVFGYGRAVRLTFAVLTLACVEKAALVFGSGDANI